jgi:Ni,Fe-hydrogenase I cytochrome b subunit
MRFNFFQFCYTITLIAMVILFLGGVFTNNPDALKVGSVAGFCLFLMASIRFLVREEF